MKWLLEEVGAHQFNWYMRQYRSLREFYKLQQEFEEDENGDIED